MREEKIGRENLQSTSWDENFFKYCAFDGFSQEGGVVTSDFVTCTFQDVEWYDGLFTQVNFIDCKFVNCVFLGSTFADNRFVECTLTNCRFVKDNLDAACTFPGTVAYACSFEGGEGFLLEAGK
jgi:uncharacterized protein YjbI with pentapeptide repeats